MAGQAHYTSAPPSAGARHGGFRFTAVSPAARPALDVLSPLTGYAPPPGAARLPEFPVAFAYDRPGGDAVVLTRTRYTGRDYTGRWGNHFCHALYATLDELAGLRPVELWDTPQWAPAPELDDGRPLPDLTELLPGSSVGPERVRRVLDGTGEGGICLLERLLTAALRALAGEGDGVTLVSADPERVVDWIAAVSYTLPAGLAARLTFTTYTARPGDDHRHLTGTRPQTVERARGSGAPPRPTGRARVPAALRHGPVPRGRVGERAPRRGGRGRRPVGRGPLGLGRGGRAAATGRVRAAGTGRRGRGLGRRGLWARSPRAGFRAWGRRAGFWARGLRAGFRALARRGAQEPERASRVPWWRGPGREKE